MTMQVEFKGLSRQLNMAILTMAKISLPKGFDVSDDAPNDYESLVKHVDNTGRICVWSGASETTIYGDREVNYAFRAWHDFVHFTYKFNFSVVGEISTWVIQYNQLIKRFGDSPEIRKFVSYLKAEIVGQARYEVKFGEFPIDQFAFVLDYVETGKIHRKF